MGFYDDAKSVEHYIKMCEAFDNDWVIGKLQTFLKPGSSLIELGMGPGNDLNRLKELYQVLGTDKSKVFLERYHKAYPKVPVMELDAVHPDLSQTFDCVYSNKVLQHLTEEAFMESIENQCRLLNTGGILFHTLWYGEGEQRCGELLFRNYTETSLVTAFQQFYEVVHYERYMEAEEMDSILIVCRKQ